MDQETSRHFVEHVKDLERRAIEGDHNAAKSLACMALLAEGFRPGGGDGGGEVIDITAFLPAYLKAA